MSEDTRYGTEDGYRDGQAGTRPVHDPARNAASTDDDEYATAYRRAYRRAQLARQPLFTITVRLHDDDQFDPADEEYTAEEIAAMAKASVEMVWDDIWATVEERPFRGQDVIVSAALPDGTLVHSISK